LVNTVGAVLEFVCNETHKICMEFFLGGGDGSDRDFGGM